MSATWKNRDFEIGQDAWEHLHSQRRFLPKYPGEEVVRFVFGRLLGPRCHAVSKVLDLGSGGGRHTVFLAKEGFATVSVDFSATGLLETARRLSVEKVCAALIQADMHKLPFPDSSFDALIAYGSLYYTDWAGMRQAVKEVHRVLKKGGMTLVVTRSKADCRFGKGEALDDHTFVFNTNETNEKGMKNCFLSEKDIPELFGDFGEISLDLNEYTLNNRTVHNSDWVIVAVK